jgi:hypothetical protein
MAKNNVEIQEITEKLEKLTGKKVIIGEGTWALTKDPNAYKQAKQELEAFKDKYYNLIGDDDMFDGIDTAVGRIEELEKIATSVTPNKPE